MKENGVVSKMFAVAGARVSRGDGYGQWNTSGRTVAVLGFSVASLLGWAGNTFSWQGAGTGCCGVR